MENKNSYKKLFSYLETPEPPARLSGAIFETIKMGRMKLTRRKFIFGLISAFVSGIGLVPVSKYFIAEIYQSNFYQYFSLILSDTDFVFKYWHNLGLAMIESLPAAGAGAVLAVLFIFLISLRNILRNSKSVFNYQLNKLSI